MKLYRYLNFLLNFFILAPVLQAQVPDVRIELGETELKAGLPFEITVVVRNTQDRSDVVFPNLKGLEKGSTTRVRSSLPAGDKSIPQEVVVQQYFFSSAYLEVPSSEVLIDGKHFAVPGFTLRTKRADRDSLAPGGEDVLLQIDDALPDNLEREDVFLTVRPTKQRVYIREGFGVYLSLFVAKDVRLSMEFFDLDKQLAEISKQIKPDGCWEENTWIDEIVPRSLKIRDRDYTEYRLYQSVLFPLIQKDVRFPVIGLKMNMGDRVQNTRVFYSKPVVVDVRPLPPHPRRDAVAVGSYQLVEALSTVHTSVGQPFRYRFGISGEGNITAISAPTTIPVQTFEFYPPEVSQTSRTDLKIVNGSKNFDYTLVARQKGLFPLKGYFQWVFFDPVREAYDTLRSEKTIEVSGRGSGRGVAESVVPIGENRLYANLEQLNSESVHRNYSSIFRIVMNVVVILMLVSALWVFRK